MQTSDKIKVLDTFLDLVGLKQSKGKTYIETLLKMFKEPVDITTPLNIIYKTIANIHETTVPNVEFNIRRAREQLTKNPKDIFSKTPCDLTNKKFINELIIALDCELKNPNLISKKTW